MKLKLSSKSKTLQDLKGLISNAEILPLFCFNAIKYNLQKDTILDQCMEQFNTNLIVRSSSANEDNQNYDKKFKAYCKKNDLEVKKGSTDFYVVENK